MKIHSFSFTNKDTNLQIEPIHFKDLTLLVGASGVGKTQILRAIQCLRNVAEGSFEFVVKWDISFSINKDKYEWAGEFKHHEKGKLVTSFSFEGKEKRRDINIPIVLYERIIFNGQVFIERQETILIFKGEKSPIPIKAEQSVLALVPEPVIQTAQKAFRNIVYSDYTNSADGIKLTEGMEKKEIAKYSSLDEIKNSSEKIEVKLFWVYKKDKKLFNQIKQTFTEIFPLIEGLKVEPLPNDRLFHFIQFKEAEIEEWLSVVDISAGMYRTFIHILELYLSADGTIILIDEFENSLGINCIDELTTEMKAAAGRLQFIITSHHPYIINNIGVNNWKIVTKSGAKIFAQDAADFQLGKSKHEAFVQLLNLPAFKTGRRNA